MDVARTRLAPSPTGALHLGNARTFLINWAMARRRGWRIVLRIEDLDGPRIKSGADRLAIDLLRWLGVDWDEGPYYQLNDLSRYHDALAQLGASGLLYPCRCSRSEVAWAQSAPHGDEHDLRYPGTCRTDDNTPIAYDPSLAEVCWRVKTADEPIAFNDTFLGPRSVNIRQNTGDFIVATRAGLPAYQLAVVVDDAAQGVTHVVRGEDLVPSTPRQLFLYNALGLGPIPTYCHVPLVVGGDGRRLAKRHGDTRLDAYRQRGVTADRVIGLIAHWCGLGERHEMSSAQFAQRLELDKIPKKPAVFSRDDDDWLTHTP